MGMHVIQAMSDHGGDPRDDDSQLQLNMHVRQRQYGVGRIHGWRALAEDTEQRQEDDSSASIVKIELGHLIITAVTRVQMSNVDKAEGFFASM